MDYVYNNNRKCVNALRKVSTLETIFEFSVFRLAIYLGNISSAGIFLHEEDLNFIYQIVNCYQRLKLDSQYKLNVVKKS